MTSLGRRGLQRIRDVATARLQQSERGITLVLFAMAMVAVIGMVAVGVDGGRIYDERREAQNAADHAALAAAYASCTSTLTDPAALQGLAEAAGLASALGNGYDDGTTNDVTINVVTGGADHTYTATVDTTIETTFARVIGFATMDTSAFAEATATGCDETAGGEVPAIHAGGTTCNDVGKQNVYIDGNDHTVNGLSHSNGDWKTNGDLSDFVNPASPSVTYRTTFIGKKPGNTYTDAEEQETDIQPWPTGFDPGVMSDITWWNKYRDSPHRIGTNNNASSFNITSNGIYYTDYTGDVTINSITNGAQFTVVSRRGPIRMGNEHTGVYHAFPNNPDGTPENVIAVSGFSFPSQPCAQMAFLRSGNKGTWNGVFWAPRATLEWSGNEGIINGGLIGWSVKLNGNEHIINGGTGQSAEVPDVLLTQ